MPDFFHREDGSQAETAFETWATARGVAFARYGWDRPPVPDFYKVPPFVLKTPDYIAYWQNHHVFVEAKGTGKDKRLKIKLGDMEAAAQWHSYLPYWFFVWNSARRCFALVSFPEMQILTAEKPVEAFTSGVEYFVIPHREIGWTTLDRPT